MKRNGSSRNDLGAKAAAPYLMIGKLDHVTDGKKKAEYYQWPIAGENVLPIGSPTNNIVTSIISQ